MYIQVKKIVFLLSNDLSTQSFLAFKMTKLLPNSIQPYKKEKEKLILKSCEHDPNY